MRDRRACLALVALLVVAASAARAEPVSFARADGVRIDAHWFPIEASGPRPAVIALHGCGGLYGRDGRTLKTRYREYVDRLHRAGYHVLLPDSFGSRGSGPICRERNSARTIKVDTRRGDVGAAVQWLAARADVDRTRIALLGWSNGGSAALAAADAALPDSAPPVAGVVVFYPGCGALLKQPVAFHEPLLMLLGEKDDWTPADRCLQLADRIRAAQPQADVTVKVYADSYHDFDSRRPLRYHADVPNGVAGSGVHAGGNDAARVEAQHEMDQFLARILR